MNLGRRHQAGMTANGKCQRAEGLRDYETTRLRDYGTTGPRDYETTGPHDDESAGHAFFFWQSENPRCMFRRHS